MIQSLSGSWVEVTEVNGWGPEAGVSLPKCYLGPVSGGCSAPAGRLCDSLGSRRLVVSDWGYSLNFNSLHPGCALHISLCAGFPCVGLCQQGC